MEARGRKVAAALAVGVVATLALGAAAARADDWARLETGPSAEANHGSLGLYLVSIHDSEKGAKEAINTAFKFLNESKLEWIVALREAALVIEGEKRPAALLRVLEPTGNVVAEIPLPAKDEELGEKLKGFLFKRCKPNPGATFRKPDAPAFEVAPPPGWTLKDVGAFAGGECVLAGPEERVAWLGTSTSEKPLAEVEAETRKLLEEGGMQKLSGAQHAKSKAQTGKVKVSYVNAGGAKGFTFLDVVAAKKKGEPKVVFGVVVGGKGASEKEAEALLLHLKKGYKP